MRGPKPPPIKLSESQRRILEQIKRRQTCVQRVVRRGCIILEIAREQNNVQVGRQLGVDTADNYIDVKGPQVVFDVLQEVWMIFISRGGVHRFPGALIEEYVIFERFVDELNQNIIPDEMGRRIPSNTWEWRQIEEESHR